MFVFLVSVVYCVQRYDMPLSRGNDLHGCRRLLHECTHSSGYGGLRHSAADAPDAALRRPRGSMGLRLSLQNGGGENHTVPAALHDALCSEVHGLRRPA